MFLARRLCLHGDDGMTGEQLRITEIALGCRALTRQVSVSGVRLGAFCLGCERLGPGPHRGPSSHAEGEAFTCQGLSFGVTKPGGRRSTRRSGISAHSKIVLRTS